ncbi:hypothetical protein JCM21900_000879 [Sporobolomyces salmonicolor]
MGSNDPGSKSEILSLASSMNPTFVNTRLICFIFCGDAKSRVDDQSWRSVETDQRCVVFQWTWITLSSESTAIVGGVVGGIVRIALIAALLLYLRRKHDAAIRSAADGLSLYSAPRREKRGSMRYAPGPRSTAIGPAAGGGGMVVHPRPPGT